MASTIITKNGTGSAVPSSLTHGELAINVDQGNLYYGTSGSTAVSSSFIFTSVSASSFQGDGSGLSNVTATLPAGVVSASGTHITASGNISASGNIEANQYIAEGKNFAAYANGTFTLAGGSGTTLINLGKSNQAMPIFCNGAITSSTNISASGTIFTSNIQIVGNRLTYANDDISFVDTGLNVAGGNITASSNISASGDILTSGNVTALGTGSFGRLQATSNVALQVTNSQQIMFENSSGTEFGNIQMNTNDDMLFQNLRSNKDLIIRAGNGSNEGHFIIQPGGDTSTNIAKFGKTADLALSGNFTASGNISSSGDVIADSYDAKTSETGYKLSGAKGLFVESGTVVGRRTTSTVITGSTIQLGRNTIANVTASGDISASGEIYSDNIETFWTSFNCDGDTAFATSMYGPNTQGINFYNWSKNWSTTTSDSGNPTGDQVHRTEINSGWYVPYKIRICELAGGFTDGNASATVGATMSLFNTVASFKSADLDTNTATTKEFIVSGSATLNGNRWKHYSQTCDVILEEGQYVLPRVKMGANLANLRGQFTIKYKRAK